MSITKKKRIYNQHYMVLKRLKEDAKGDVIKCFYLTGFSKFGKCIIKEGKSGEFNDKNGRDMVVKMKWQKYLHHNLANKVSIPKLIDAFEENTNFYIAIEYIKGKSLSKKWHELENKSDKFNPGSKTVTIHLDYLLEAIKIIKNFHEAGYVHRDITPENFIVTNKNKVYLIDLELAYCLTDKTPTPPFILGTFGYMSPEQLNIQEPTIYEDIFALGALIFKCFTGIDPIKITRNNYTLISRSIRFLINDVKVAEIILKCFNPSASERPHTEIIYNTLHEYQQNRIQKIERKPYTHQQKFTIEQFKGSIQDAINTISSPTMADDYEWFSEKINKTNLSSFGKIDQEIYPYYNKGAAGVIYMLSIAKKIGFDVSSSNPYVNKGLKTIEEFYQKSNSEMTGSLHFGTAGIAACISTALSNDLFNYSSSYLTWIDKFLLGNSKQLGIMNGLSGISLANMICEKYTDNNLMRKRIFQHTDHIIANQNSDGSWLRTNSNNKKLKISGFANGISGIVYYLLTFYEKYKEETSIRSAIKGLKWLMNNAIDKNSIIQWKTYKDIEMSKWWCEGNIGISLTFLKAYQIFNEVKYKQYAVRSLKIFHKNFIDNNLSQCHGLAGLGEVYLEAYKTLQEEEWIERADWIGQALMNLKLEHPKKGTYWLTEKVHVPVADFMNGNSGVIHFLMHYCYKECVNFPLLSPSN